MDLRHQKVKDIFFQTFSSAGMSIFPSDSLVSNDDTVYFTCATITPLKGFIEKSNLDTGMYMHQPCLRLQTLKDPFAPAKKYQFPSYFNMLGTLIPKEEIAFYQKAIIELFNNLEVKPEDMKILATEECAPLLEYLGKYYSVELNSKPEKYYHWTYGLKDNIQGIGLTFSIKQPNASYRDIGQYVAIKNDKEIIGAEFGFGIETFLAAAQKMKNPYEAYSVAAALANNDMPQSFVYTDVFSAVGAMYATGLTVQTAPSIGYKRILKQALNNLCYLSVKDNISDEKVHKVLSDFMSIEFGNASGAEALYQDYIAKRVEFFAAMKNRDNFIWSRECVGKDPKYIALRAQKLYPMIYRYEQIKEY